MIKRRTVLCFIFSFAFALGCARSDDQPHDGQTHWLESCEKNSDCGELECVCGFCVQTCDEDRACDVEGMTTDCKAVDSDAVGALCPTEEPPERVCLEPCSGDSKCDKNQACIGGACVPVESEPDESEPDESDASSLDSDAAQAYPVPPDSSEDASVTPRSFSHDELLSCLSGEVTMDQDVNKVDAIDLLFVVDNSRSMEQEQAKLREQLPRMIKVLTTGDKTPDNGVEDNDFPPVSDLHLAVVSSDMGLPGLAPEDNPDSTGTCVDTGDDGKFLNDPTNAIAAGLNCPGVVNAGYPIFLEYIRDDREEWTVTLQNAEETAANFACMTTVGTNGCGFEMPLESALKALWPSQLSNLSQAQESLGISFLAGSQGHGDNEHRSFLRGTPYNPTEADRLSLLAIVVVTDEADCSAGAQGNLDFLSLNFPGGDHQDLNLRCYKDTINEWGNKYPVERYIEGFKALRPDVSDLVVFAAIAGIPPQIEMDSNGDNDITALEHRAFFDRILDHKYMQETPNTYGDNLNFSCQHQSTNGEFDTQAFPARRLTEVAKGFGVNGTIQSICADDFSPAMRSIVDVISNKIGGVCLPRPYSRNSKGMIDCNVTWTMPPGRTCDDYEYLSDPSEDSPQLRNGRKICDVDQIPVINTDTDDPAEALDFTYKSGLGWYYDDFSADMERTCKTTDQITTKQRISFALNPGMNGQNEDPPSGVSIDLTCRSDSAGDRSATEQDGASHQWSCEWDGCSEGDFYCDDATGLCVARCQTDADCEDNDLAGWQCLLANQDEDEGFCVPATCH